MTRGTTRKTMTVSAGVAAGVAVFVGALAGAGVAMADGADGLAVELSECVELESEAERFACYERHVQSALRERGNAAPAQSEGSPPGTVTRPGESGPHVPDAEPSTVRREELSGSAPVDTQAGAPRGPDMADFGFRRPVQPRERQAVELIATVESLRETVPNTYVITLQNGQVWRQMRPQWYPLRPGTEVRIYPTSWGTAYRLAADELGGFIQVERVR
jgi:hypothetical protein